MQRNTSTQRARRRASGFTLVEILISLGIFLIGMTAIVSLFPAAAILQRETTQEVIADLAAESAEAIINANGLSYEPPSSTDTGELDNYHSVSGFNDTDVVPLRTVMNNTTFDNIFPSFVRSYPTGVIDTTAGTAFDAIKGCDLHWVPFLQDLAGEPSSPNWVMRLFIVRSDSRGTYTANTTFDANPTDPNNFPKVRYVTATASGSTFTISGSTDLEPSDIIMDSNGNNHVVLEIDGSDITVVNPIPLTPETPNKLWYAPRGGANTRDSPAQRIITVEVNLGD